MHIEIACCVVWIKFVIFQQKSGEKTVFILFCTRDFSIDFSIIYMLKYISVKVFVTDGIAEYRRGAKIVFVVRLGNSTLLKVNCPFLFLVNYPKGDI